MKAVIYKRYIEPAWHQQVRIEVILSCTTDIDPQHQVMIEHATLTPRCLLFNEPSTTDAIKVADAVADAIDYVLG
jgi:hypothetical protein